MRMQIGLQMNLMQEKQIRIQETLEAAPRFELGVKLLQSLALPLGYAA
jgi:hypothetical protein